MTTYKTNDLFGIPDELNKPATTAKQHKSVKASTASVVDSTARLPGRVFYLGSQGVVAPGLPSQFLPSSAPLSTGANESRRVPSGLKLFSTKTCLKP